MKMMNEEGRITDISIREVKERVNEHASAFARIRKSWGKIPKVEMYERSLYEQEARAAWNLAYQFFKIEDGNCRYFTLELGDFDYHGYLYKRLMSYDPDKGASFMTYLEKSLLHRNNDWLNQRDTSVDRPTGGDEPTGRDPIPDPTSEPETHDALRLWGDYADFICELVAAKKSENGRKIVRYRVYATRDYLIQVCDNYNEEIALIKQQVDRLLDQPYVLYLKDETVENAEDAARKLVKKIDSLTLKMMYQTRKLIEERYLKVGSLNTYFRMTNLNVDIKSYRTIQREFFRAQLIG